MKEYKPEDYLKLYEKIPKELQKLVWEEDLDRRRKDLASRFDLSEAKEERLDILILHLLLGILPPKEIKETFKKELVLSEEEAKKLTSDFIQHIVSPIKHLLKDVYDEDDFVSVGLKRSSSQEEEKEKEDPYREPLE